MIVVVELILKLLSKIPCVSPTDKKNLANCPPSNTTNTKGIKLRLSNLELQLEKHTQKFNDYISNTENATNLRGQLLDKSIETTKLEMEHQNKLLQLQLENTQKSYDHLSNKIDKCITYIEKTRDDLNDDFDGLRRKIRICENEAGHLETPHNRRRQHIKILTTSSPLKKSWR